MDKNIMPLLTDELKLPYYVTAVGGEKNQQHIVRPEGYQNYHWFYCTKGKGVLVTQENEYTISGNMGFFLFPHSPHEYYAVEIPWETHWVVFDGFGMSDLMNALGFKDAFPYGINVIHLVNRLHNDIYVSAQSKKLTRGYKCSYQLYNLLIELKSCTSSYLGKPRSTMYESIQPVITFIEEHYNCDFTLQSLAEEMNVSQQYLCRVFNQVLNMRPFEYLTRYRIQKAKEYLIQDFGLTVNKIAEIVGYHDTSYFCAKFKKYEGITPIDFRKIYNSRW